MLERSKYIAVIDSTVRITCDACGKIVWQHRSQDNIKRDYWECYNASLNPAYVTDDVQICKDCFNEALEYIRVEKEEERNNNLKNNPPIRKRLYSPKRNNSR
jgi:hypothetical protein